MEPRETLLHVRGMSCQSCVRHVGEAARSVPGVRQVDVDLDAGTVRITHVPDAELARVIAAIEDAGYEVSA